MLHHKYTKHNRPFSFSAQPLLCLLFVIALICSSNSFAEEPNYDEIYQQMVVKALEMPEDFDFAKVREVYTKTSYYGPYSEDPVIKFKREFYKRLKEYDEVAMKDMETYVLRHFAQFQAHSRAQGMTTKFQKMDKAAYHQWATKGLIFAYLRSGDGKSEQTAYKPLSISEEGYITRNKPCVKHIQRLHQGDTGIYDIITCTLEDGTEEDIWFDVSPLFASQKM